MSEKYRSIGFRLLSSVDRYDKGDELYNVSMHTWEKVSPKIIGLYHDPSNTTPARRKFILPPDKSIEDVDPEEKPKPKLEVDKLQEPIDILVQQATGLCQIKISKDNLSPSGNHIMVCINDQDVWMKTEYLDQIFVEKL